MMSLPVWLLGPVFLPRDGGSWSLVPCSFWGSLCLGGLCQGDPTVKSGGTHPTGKHEILVFTCNSKMVCLLILVQTKCECLET